MDRCSVVVVGVVRVDDVDVDDKCDDRSFNAVLNPLPRRSIAALSF